MSGLATLIRAGATRNRVQIPLHRSRERRFVVHRLLESLTPDLAAVKVGRPTKLFDPSARDRKVHR